MEELQFREKHYNKHKAKNFNELKKAYDEMLPDADDYGSSVIFAEIMMNLMFQVVDSSPVGGFTGFQAGCLVFPLIRRYGGYSSDSMLRIMDYKNILYPQYDKSFREINYDTFEKLKKIANDKLFEEENPESICPKVLQRWKEVSSGNLPHFVTVTIKE